MSFELVSYLSRYIPISEDLENIFMKSSFVQNFPKGTVLLREGDRIERAYFVLKGCIRSFIHKNGEDKTIDFFIEEEAVLPMGYGRAVVSEHFLECLEDTVAVTGTADQEEKMLSEYPQLKAVCLAMSEIMAEKLQENLARYKTSTPEERYRDLMEKRPDLLQRIPQYQIASYLGVKPESLSRIRKRLSRPKGDKNNSGLS
ncbi:MAG: cyclic nucleotide-binding protein [Treponema sp. RIFOXYC1_FULL_61_9]|nr:MAG: cyclic nucleotide-binding protein [Treponema sp. RIFOXYC1_FULL_61_9]